MQATFPRTAAIGKPQASTHERDSHFPFTCLSQGGTTTALCADTWIRMNEHKL